MNTRQVIAQLINAEPEEIAFIKNTTQGVLIAANGIKWNEGENVVLPHGEFPANVYPWLALKERGVEVRLVNPVYPWLALKERGVEVRLVNPVDGKVTADMLMEACDGKTRAVSVSAVQFSTGYRVDLEKLTWKSLDDSLKNMTFTSTWTGSRRSG